MASVLENKPSSVLQVTSLGHDNLKVLRPFVAERIHAVRKATTESGYLSVASAKHFKDMQPDDWLHISNDSLEDFKHLALSLRVFTGAYPIYQSERTELNPYLNEIRGKLTPNRAFQDHLDIMSAYVEVLFDQEFLGENTFSKLGVSKNFLLACVWMHDFGRNIFNGLSVYQTDRYSHAIEKNLFPGFPYEYLHTLDWITGNTKIPASGNSLSLVEEIGVAGKLIDSIGKDSRVGDHRILRGFTEMYQVDGSFDSWVETNTKAGRLPFTVKRRDPNTNQLNDYLVETETYRQNEIRIATMGAEVVQQVTGMHIDQITSEVARRLGVVDPHPKLSIKKPESSAPLYSPVYVGK